MAVNTVAQVFKEVGWTVEEIRYDYGEDLLVRIVEQESVTPYSFYIQVKGTDRIGRYITKDGRLKYPFESWRFDHWANFAELIIIAVWDSRSGSLYWESVQNPENPIIDKGNGWTYLILPKENLLDSRGILRVKTKAISRLKRLEREQMGALALLGHLQEMTGRTIEYTPDLEMLVIDDPAGGAIVTFFGELAEMISTGADRRGVSFDEFVEQALGMKVEIVERLNSGKKVAIIDANGGIISQWASAEQFFRDIKSMDE